MRLKLALFVTIVLLHKIAHSQQEIAGPDPKIGQPFTSYTFKDFENSALNSFSIKQGQGKWLVLDFWDELCAACINSFPELNSIHNKYGNRLQLISVAYTGSMKPGHSSYSSIKQLWKRINNKYHFKFPVAFDSLLFDRFEIGGVGCPYIVVIDPIGTVRAVSTEIKEKHIQNILNGDLSLLSSVDRGTKESDWQIHDNEIYLNSLSHALKGSPFLMNPYLNDTSKTDKLQIIGMPLDYLYRYAYTGQIDWDSNEDRLYSSFKYFPILEIKDTGIFAKDKRYSYSLKLSEKHSKLELMDILKTALRQAFGFNVKIEERDAPYWKVSLVDSMKYKIISKGGEPYLKKNGKFMGFEAKNVPVSILINQLWSHFQLHHEGGGIGRPTGKGKPFVDETGLRENIDLKIDAFTEDFEEFRSALSQKGIKVEEARKKMNCLIIAE